MAEKKTSVELKNEKDLRKPYVKPEVESAKIYERLALACGLATPLCFPPLKSG